MPLNRPGPVVIDISGYDQGSVARGQRPSVRAWYWVESALHHGCIVLLISRFVTSDLSCNFRQKTPKNNLHVAPYTRNRGIQG